MPIESATFDADGVVRTNGLVITNIFALQEQIMDHGVDMWGAPATGLPLHTNGNLGVDLLQVQPGDRFPVHTHHGDHLLLCLKGSGTISIGQETYEVKPGDLYMVPGLVPHAVGAPVDDERGAQVPPLGEPCQTHPRLAGIVRVEGQTPPRRARHPVHRHHHRAATPEPWTPRRHGSAQPRRQSRH